MSTTEYRCPDCGVALDVTTRAGSRAYLCPDCHGHLYGLSPFERMVEEDLGARLWVESADGATAGPCPICALPMHQPASGPLSFCRLCYEVWVPAGADEWLSSHRVAGRPAHDYPTECTTCGAPWDPDEEGKCVFCRAQITAPGPVVVFELPN